MEFIRTLPFLFSTNMGRMPEVHSFRLEESWTCSGWRAVIIWALPVTDNIWALPVTGIFILSHRGFTRTQSVRVREYPISHSYWGFKPGLSAKSQLHTKWGVIKSVYIPVCLGCTTRLSTNQSSSAINTI